jgi:hypothetical protein
VGAGLVEASGEREEEAGIRSDFRRSGCPAREG